MTTSLSCDPRNAPIQFHWYRAEHGQTLAQFFTDILVGNGVTNREVQSLARAELRQRLRQYCEARLTDVGDVRNISRNPAFHLFEIRLTMRGIGLFRMYFIEPSILGHVGVGLHMHLKNTMLPSERSVKEAQDVEIDIATRRCAAGGPTNWSFELG